MRASRADLRLMLAGLAAVSFLVTSATAFGSTPLRAFKAHIWRFVLLSEQPTAQAFSCRGCEADLILRCVTPGRGLIELKLVSAAVSNGRNGATKQIRFSFGSDQLWRRAVTQRLASGYAPLVELGYDDDLLDHLAKNQLLKISFYGQHSYVGLRGAAGAISMVLEACRPTGTQGRARHCVWTSVVACSSDRAEAEVLRNSIPASFIRSVSDGHCVSLASEVLATAKARVVRYGGHVERSCLN